jgi:hypothetical protein
MDAARLGLAALLALAMTGAADLEQRARDEAKAAFLRFELRPFPRLVFDTEGTSLAPNELARAVLYEGGREEVWVSMRALRSDDLWLILDHETAHLKAWREHGPGVDTHGPEFMATCRKYALSERACTEDHPI